MQSKLFVERGAFQTCQWLLAAKKIVPVIEKEAIADYCCSLRAKQARFVGKRRQKDWGKTLELATLYLQLLFSTAIPRNTAS